MTRAVSSLQTHTKMALTLSEAGVELAAGHYHMSALLRVSYQVLAGQAYQRLRSERKNVV